MRGYSCTRLRGGTVTNDELYQKLLRGKGITIPASPIISRAGKTDAFGLSDAQQGIWFLQQLDPESAAFNNGTALKVEGKLNVDAMRSALESIVNRHEVLRGSYVLDKGTPKAIPRDEPLDFTCISLEDREKSAAAADVMNVITNIISSKMDLERGPLISFTLLRINEQEHVLVIAVHHIVADGWSKSILLQEFSRFYEEENGGQPSGMKPLALQYRDYVDWISQGSVGLHVEHDLNFWTDKLKGAPPLLELPTDYKRSAVMSGIGGLEPFELNEKLYEQVQDFCKQERISVFTFLLAVFKTLLYRYSAAEDLLVGTPVAGRPRKELEDLIGMFVNSVVIRSQPRGDLPFIDYMRRVHKQSLLAFDHQHVPFHRIVGEMNPSRDQSYHPIFQTMFQMDNIPVPELKVQNIRLSVIPLDMGFSQNDLTVSCWEEGNKLCGTFEFSSDLFTRQSIRCWISSYVQLLRSVLERPNEVLDNHTLLDDGQLQTILEDWNRTELGHRAIPFGRMIEQRVLESPEQCAILEGENSISYGNLDRLIRLITAELTEKGMLSSTPVIVCLPSSAKFVAACLAVSRVGGVVVPVDPAQPTERIQAILNEFCYAYAISDAKHMAHLPIRKRCVVIEEVESKIKHEHPLHNNGELLWNADDVAYIVFTSGTTGIPKGVMLKQRSIDNLVHSFISSYEVNRSDRLLPVTSVASSSFIGEMIPILAAGGTLVLPETELLLHPAQLKSYMEKHQVTVLSTVPSMLKRLNDEGTPPSGLRLVLSGGETLLASHVNRLTGITLANGYGLSESGVCSTYSLVRHNGDDSEEVLSVFSSLGKPVAGQQVYVLNALLQPVPIGVRGQICISGCGLARGYLNDPELTHQKFRSHPFLPGETLLLTGDYGCWTGKGELLFMGRVDRQVQIRGYRIEIDEVEKHLTTYPDIVEAVVHPQRDNEDNLQLVAYYTVRKMKSIIAGRLSSWLGTLIPAYMKPVVYIELETIPRNRNGKLDTAALPKLDRLQGRVTAAYDRPVTTTENTIYNIWVQALHISNFGICDNFFDLGGHSLLLAKVLDQLNHCFDDRLSLISLFKYPTVQSLAACLDEQTEASSTNKIRETARNQQNAFRRYRKSFSPSVAGSTEKDGGLT